VESFAPKRRIHPPLRVERFSLPRNSHFPRKKAHFDRAKALTVRLLWMVVDCRGKGAKSLPTASQPS